MKTLLGFLGDDKGDTLPESVKIDSPPESIETLFRYENNWEERSERMFYFGTLIPNEFNRDYLFNAIDNLVHDLLLPDGQKWSSEEPFSETGMQIPSLKLRLDQDDEGYKLVEDKIGPVEEALEKELDNPEKNKKYSEAIKKCGVIKKTCKEEHSVERLIKSPAAKLEDSVNKIISENGLQVIARH